MTSHSWIWKDAQFQPLACVPIEDRGFRYGMSVFETLAVVKKRVLLIAEHLRRLETTAAFLEFPINRSALRALSAFSELLPAEEGLLRIYWTAGDGGPADPFLEGRLILRYEEMSLPGSSAPPLTLSLVSIKAHLSEQDGWKTGNYLLRCRLLAEARRRQASEALLYDDSGLLMGAIMANVFIVSDEGRLVTPQLRPGCRNGTVREWIMRHSEVEERDIPMEELVAAPREIFLTNSRIGVAEVRDFEGKKLERNEVSQKIAHSYRELFHARCS